MIGKHNLPSVVQGAFARMDSFLTDEYQGFTFAGEAFDVEVSGLNTEHFTFTRLPTFVAVDDRLFRGVVGLLRMGHCKTSKQKIFQPEQKEYFLQYKTLCSQTLSIMVQVYLVTFYARLKSYHHFI